MMCAFRIAVVFWAISFEQNSILCYYYNERHTVMSINYDPNRIWGQQTRSIVFLLVFFSYNSDEYKYCKAIFSRSGFFRLIFRLDLKKNH